MSECFRRTRDRIIYAKAKEKHILRRQKLNLQMLSVHGPMKPHGPNQSALVGKDK